ncbi:hypothetical protein D4M90_10820 [Klebsiella oxytoca]|nr:hypothetical protein D4M90_10820 [Klebsiella oxytoca]
MREKQPLHYARNAVSCSRFYWVPSPQLSGPKSFELQKGDDAANFQELTSVSDWDVRGKLTHLQLEE